MFEIAKNRAMSRANVISSLDEYFQSTKLPIEVLENHKTDENKDLVGVISAFIGKKDMRTTKCLADQIIGMICLKFSLFILNLLENL